MVFKMEAVLRTKKGIYCIYMWLLLRARMGKEVGRYLGGDGMFHSQGDPGM
jgi:hypothetical protein